MGYSKLEKNLIDLMKEEQAKLGYRKEAVRLYYPLSSLNHLFDAEDSVDAMQERLIHFPEDMTAKLGMLTVTHKGDRFCSVFRRVSAIRIITALRMKDVILSITDFCRKITRISIFNNTRLINQTGL